VQAREDRVQEGQLALEPGASRPTVDQRVDIFAVGILLYELLTGKRLFLGENDLQTVRLVRGVRRTPTDGEQQTNRRAASARLRVVERIEDSPTRGRR
jgi:serine/threonine protein kinase